MDRTRARRRARFSIVGLGLVAALAAWSIAPALDAAGKSGEHDERDTSPGFEATIDAVTADMTIRQWRVTAEGTRTGIDPPGVSVRLEAARHGSGWRTSLTTTGLDRAVAAGVTGSQFLDNPFLVSRLEFDDDGTPPRMYDGRGRLMLGPGENERRALGLPENLRDKDWDPSSILGRGSAAERGLGRTRMAGLVVGVADGPKRRADIERRFGKRTGQVRGHDQFIFRDGATVHEVLVAADSSLPIEMNETTAGQLTARAQFDYDTEGSDALVRRHMRAEQAIGNSGGGRMVTDLLVTQLTLERRGGR